MEICGSKYFMFNEDTKILNNIYVCIMGELVKRTDKNMRKLKEKNIGEV